MPRSSSGLKTRSWAFIQNRNVDEIKKDAALRFFGSLLFFTHVLTFIRWYPSFYETLTRPGVPYCWPFFQDCYKLRPFDPTQLKVALYIYLALSIFGFCAFFFEKWAVAAYWLLVLLLPAKFAFFAQDYRMMGNYHYMLFIIFFIYLFMPRKRATVMFMIVGFYVAAALLKMNHEWLSGSSVMPRSSLNRFLPAPIFAVLCCYVFLLEILISWLLLARNSLFFWGAMFQFVAFHIFSWHIVGFYYPCVMFCLLPIFAFVRWFPNPKTDPKEPYVKWLACGRAPKTTYGLLAVFFAAQLLPKINGGDSTLTCEGRMFAMNMFDSRSECLGYFVIHGDKGRRIYSPSFNFGIILHCDPMVYYDFAQNLCRNIKNGTEISGQLDVNLKSKRTTEDSFRQIISVEDFCSKNLKYSMWGFNKWVQKN